MTDRVPPHDEEAERQLLNAFMLQPEQTAKATAGIVKTEDFYRPAHRVIYDAVTRAIDAGLKPDVVILKADLEERQELKLVGGVPGLVEATMTLNGYSSNALRYVEIISHHARNRELIAAADAIKAMAWSGKPCAENAFAAQQLVQEIVDATNRRVHLRTMDEMLDDYVAVLEAREKGEGLGIDTGWRDLDLIVQGLRGGELILVGAAPKTGKSTWAANLVRHAIKTGHRVLLVSVEMSETEIMERVMAAEGGIDLARLRTGKLTPTDWAKVGTASAQLSGKLLTILDDPNASMAEVRAAGLRTQAEMIVIDYTQLMKAEIHRGGTREQVVAELTSSMKRLARELDIPVVALSQVKRDAADGPPGLTDFAESSSFEKNANLLVGLHRPISDPGIMEVNVIASRQTKTGMVRLAYHGEYQRISDMAQMAAPSPRYN